MFISHWMRRFQRFKLLDARSVGIQCTKIKWYMAAYANKHFTYFLRWVLYFYGHSGPQAVGFLCFPGVTTVLTMAFLGIDNRTDLPKVPYSTALDYYVGVCFAFILATIIQFAGVHFFTKHGSGEIPPESDTDSDTEEIHTTTVCVILKFHFNINTVI